MKATAKNPLSLKTQLLLVLIPMVILYTCVISIVNYSYTIRSTRGTLEKTLSETANVASEFITMNINNNNKLVSLLASRVGLLYENEITMPFEELDYAAFEEAVAAIGREYGFLHMMVADIDGYTRTVNHTDLVKNEAEYYLRIVNDGEKSFVSDVTQDKVKFNGSYVINYSAPIRNTGGKLIGVLVCKSDAAELSALVTSISTGDSGSTFIMDNNGQCIAHQDPAMLFGGESYLQYKNNPSYPTLNKLWDTMSSESTGYQTYELNGEHVAAFTGIKGTNNWSIAVAVSQAEFMQEAVSARNVAIILGIAMAVLFAIILVFLFRYTMRGMSLITDRFDSLAEGNLSAEIVIDRSSKETYRLSSAASRFMGVILEMVHETQVLLGAIAEGNLTIKPGVEYPGDFCVLKTAIETNLVKLNELIRRISRTSEEVARGSSQMASGASGLAQGASEQASSLEELFETVTTLATRTYEIGGMDVKRLADIQGEAYDEDDANAAAENRIAAADTLAEKLTIAIARIAEASADIRRIAANIESISSETGMLALNASVEATHAGEAGRGFSVIASEIHSLSDKSREAAKDADMKIDSITRAVNRGSQTVDITVSTIGEMTLAMNQVKSSLEQISNIVENIAATAEETAAGSEELSAQADLLKNLVAEFRTIE